MSVVAAMEEVLADVIARSEKSVVAIARVRRPERREPMPFELRPDAFDGRPALSAAPDPTDPDFIPNEYGTGVVIDRRGLILTAYHVLGQDSDYYVTTHDRKVYRAKIRAADPRSDLAVLAISATDLSPIAFGQAEDLRKGHLVIALGNPYGIARDGQASASWGMVANLSRKAPLQSPWSEGSSKPTLHHFGTLIQTDAKLNQGTSGGPLLDRHGKMVGLTVAMAALSGYDQAAGYAIPVDQTFRRVIETLRQGREVEYGFLGIQPANIAAEEVLRGTHGIRVARVVPGTPAARAGLKLGDLITAVDGRPIHQADGFVLSVSRLPVESVARLSLVRDGRDRSFDVRLTKYPVQSRAVVTNRPAAWRGVRIDYPTAAIDSRSGTRSGVGYFGAGVLVMEVEQDSPAASAGLRQGMHISHVGRTAVSTPREFREAVAGKTDAVELRLADGTEESVAIVPPKR